MWINVILFIFRIISPECVQEIELVLPRRRERQAHVTQARTHKKRQRKKRQQSHLEKWSVFGALNYEGVSISWWQFVLKKKSILTPITPALSADFEHIKFSFFSPPLALGWDAWMGFFQGRYTGLSLSLFCIGRARMDIQQVRHRLKRIWARAQKFPWLVSSLRN